MKVAAAVIAPMLLAACATARPAAVVPPLAERRGVVSGPGAVAWSPDGTTLAVVQRDGLALVDLRGTERRLSGPGVIAVDWSPADSLLVVERTPQGGREVVAIEPRTGERRQLHSDPSLVAARWLHEGRGWLAVAATMEVRSYGTEATQTLTIAAGRDPVEAHRWSAVLPIRAPAADLALGWAAARPSPFDHSILLPEYRKPPLRDPYLLLLAIDPFDPVPEVVARVEPVRLDATVTWSGDGVRGAVAALDGTLRIVERGQVAVASGPVQGLHPSWSPNGDLLFLGGWLATPSAGPVRQLVDRAADATGFWSPAGDRLAVVVGGRLFVFGDLPVPPPDVEASRRLASARAAAWELGSLRSSGLLAPVVYRERRDHLRESATEKP